MSDPILFESKKTKQHPSSMLRVKESQHTDYRALEFTIAEGEDGMFLTHTLYAKEVEQLITYLSSIIDA